MENIEYTGGIFGIILVFELLFVSNRLCNMHNASQSFSIGPLI